MEVTATAGSPGAQASPSPGSHPRHPDRSWASQVDRIRRWRGARSETDSECYPGAAVDSGAQHRFSGDAAAGVAVFYANFLARFLGTFVEHVFFFQRRLSLRFFIVDK